MKKLIYIIAVMLLAGACKKEGLLTYNVKDNVYFAYRFKIVQNPIIDSTDFTFAYTPPAITETIFKLPVAVTGTAKDYDRKLSITIDPASTAVAGKHYEVPTEFILHAGRLTDTILLKLKRPAELKANPVNLVFNLHANENFDTNLKVLYGFSDTVDAQRFKLNIADVIVQGTSWTGTFAQFFGTFSVKKVLLLNEVAGMPLNFFVDVSVGGINLNALGQYYAITTSRYLNDQAAAGKRVYEDDGVTPLLMAPAYQ
ncbi:DUF4843 domain-containing protein [Chitinophaga sp. SYP-B3965]|uniref:DUF4843 domain-containing protein n=1 Tax=Chitinophaga sp. SYP-B3965 TaxID=2663120 RepID=UPI0012996CED|nr:DUF4843 domain-containing protein [Chitinophaga sp. SYP-B3965]MRG44121.1 DUF4843 domain-containing protein [Chitinophaga sp. SYP-B3965]